MGNANRRVPKKPLTPISPVSTNVSPKTISKITSGTGTGFIVDGGVAIAINASAEDKEKVTMLPYRFKSLGTGTLYTPFFQPPSYQSRKPMPIPGLDGLSEQGKNSGPNTQHPQHLNAAGPSRQPVQLNVLDSSRHPKCSKPSAGVSRIQDLIKSMESLPAVNSSMHGKHLSENSLNSISSGPSSTTAFTPPSSYPAEEVSILENETKADLIINVNGLIKNRVRCLKTWLPDGQFYHTPMDGVRGDHILSDIAAMKENEKESFWAKNAIQIEVDLRDLPPAAVKDQNNEATERKNVAVGPKSTVIDQLKKLGKDFFKYATTMYVEIIFPPPREGSVVPRPQNISKNGKWIYPGYDVAASTPGFELIQKLVRELDNCVGIQYLDVIVHNVTASTSCPFTLEQLYYTLPFYEMSFVDWNILWQGNYTPYPIPIGHFPLILLDKERNRWLWSQKKQDLQKEKADRAEQQRIDKTVFITKSIAPQWCLPSMPEPFPKPFPAPKDNGEKQIFSQGERL